MLYASPDVLIKELHQEQFKPVLIFHGEEPFFIDAAIDIVEQNILSDAEKAFNMSILYGGEVDFKQVMDHARQFPMMSEKRVVIVKEAGQMRSLESLKSYFTQPSPDTVLAIAHPNKRIDGRSKWFKEVKDLPHVGIMTSDRIKEYKLGQWLDGYLNSRDRRITAQANLLLCEYLGNDLKKLTNEIAKIEINLDEQDEIGIDEVEKYVGISKSYNVFELLSALGARDVKKAHFIVQNLQDNMAANPMPMISAAFFQHFQKIMITQENANLNDRELASQLRVNPYFIKDYKTAARKYSRGSLTRIIEDILSADARSKGVDNRRTEPSQLLKELVGKVLMA